MRYILPAAAVLTLCVAAGPATKPTTAPQTDAQKAVVDFKDAESELRSASQKAIEKLRVSDPIYQKACADRDSAAKALEVARKGDSPTLKIEASSAFNKAKQKVERIEADAMNADAAVKTSRASMDAAKKRLEVAYAAEERIVLAAQRQREIAAAAAAERVKQKLVDKGMTKVEVEKMWGQPARTTIRPNGITECRYEQYEMLENVGDPGDYRGAEVDLRNMAPSPPRKEKTLVRTLVVEFKDDIVDDFEDRQVKRGGR